MATTEKTETDMAKRLSELRQLKANANLSLRTAGELDAIHNHGLKAWRQYRRKRYARG